MNVEVIRARMIGIAPEHRLEHGDELERAGRGLAVGRPELPRAQHHETFGKHRRGIQVVGILLHHRAHRIAVVAMEREPIRCRFR